MVDGSCTRTPRLPSRVSQEASAVGALEEGTCPKLAIANASVLRMARRTRNTGLERRSPIRRSDSFAKPRRCAGPEAGAPPPRTFDARLILPGRLIWRRSRAVDLRAGAPGTVRMTGLRRADSRNTRVARLRQLEPIPLLIGGGREREEIDAVGRGGRGEDRRPSGGGGEISVAF